MNREYWRGRALALYEAMEQDSRTYREAAEQAYEKALLGIRRDLSDWYQRFADNNRVSMAEARRLLNASELQELQWTVEEYIQVGQHMDSKWRKQLENVSARVHISRLEALQLQIQQQIEALFGNQLDGLDGLLRRVYADQYYHTIFEVQRAFHLGWQVAALTEQQLAMALAKPWTTDNLTFSARVWKNRTALVNTLQTELSQALIRGDSLKQVTDAMSKRLKVSKRAAGRLVMTESAYLSAQGQLAAYRELNVSQVEIVETLDTHTCAVCQGLDGTVIPISDYEPGVTVPPFHPWCRGCTAPYFADNTGGERAARNPDGQTYYVPDDMTYTEWKKRYLTEQPQKKAPEKVIGRAEIMGLPNSVVDVSGQDGIIKTRRWYDLNGKAKKDIDTTDHGNAKVHPMGAHAHDWTWTQEKGMRGKQRALTEQERQENADILQKDE